MMRSPVLVAHADWSVNRYKRWLALARPNHAGRYTVERPQPVGPISTLLPRLRLQQGKAAGVFLGVDFPIGLPLAYAQRAGVDDFLTLLPQLGQGQWSCFYAVAETADEISLRRPFYPQRPGGTKQRHLLEALGVTDMNMLRRQCERATPSRRAAAPLFWTMGAQQVGKAAISGWRDMLAPALRAPSPDLKLWPFAGPLGQLLEPGRVVVAETYPAEALLQLGLVLVPGSKRDQAVRRIWGRELTAWARAHGITLTPALAAAVADGFGSDNSGDDRFDAVAGLLAMLNVLGGRRATGYPAHRRVRRVEGWILGQVR